MKKQGVRVTTIPTAAPPEKNSIGVNPNMKQQGEYAGGFKLPTGTHVESRIKENVETQTQAGNSHTASRQGHDTHMPKSPILSLEFALFSTAPPKNTTTSPHAPGTSSLRSELLAVQPQYKQIEHRGRLQECCGRVHSGR